MNVELEAFMAKPACYVDLPNRLRIKLLKKTGNVASQ
jgi:hypothetical protein